MISYKAVSYKAVSYKECVLGVLVGTFAVRLAKNKQRNGNQGANNAAKVSE